MAKKLFILLLILAGCHYSPPDEHQLVMELIKTDKDFNQMSMESGMKKAFLFYAADSVIMPREGKLPLFGIKELKAHLETVPDQQIHLQWVPLKAEASGNIGYTFGKWELRVTGKDTVECGTYVTCWKKFPNGNWKFVLDCGQNTPKPD
jgi:ketosteroid isomerase-like protein